jgi:hypothetical protein
MTKFANINQSQNFSGQNVNNLAKMNLHWQNVVANMFTSLALLAATSLSVVAANKKNVMYVTLP